MREKPILFSAPMVRAILEGRKTQTRRVVKKNHAGRVELARRSWHIDDPDAIKACPYGQPGGRLWVRETFSVYNHHESPVVHYRADGHDFPFKWRPSIHMPRWASRINLRITGVQIERLQDISEYDAMSEGANKHTYSWPLGAPTNQAKNIGGYYRNGFRNLWDSINGNPHKKLGDISWEANPLVWVVEFERIRNYKNEKMAAIACVNSVCNFHDDTGTYEQNCAAGDKDGNPFLPECDYYLPSQKGV